MAECNGKQSLKVKERFFEIARGSALEWAAIYDVLAVCCAIDVESKGHGKPDLKRIVSMSLGGFSGPRLCRRVRSSTSTKKRQNKEIYWPRRSGQAYWKFTLAGQGDFSRWASRARMKFYVTLSVVLYAVGVGSLALMRQAGLVHGLGAFELFYGPAITIVSSWSIFGLVYALSGRK